MTFGDGLSFHRRDLCASGLAHVIIIDFTARNLAELHVICF